MQVFMKIWADGIGIVELLDVLVASASILRQFFKAG